MKDVEKLGTWNGNRYKDASGDFQLELKTEEPFHISYDKNANQIVVTRKAPIGHRAWPREVEIPFNNPVLVKIRSNAVGLVRTVRDSLFFRDANWVKKVREQRFRLWPAIIIRGRKPANKSILAVPHAEVRFFAKVEWSRELMKKLENMEKQAVDRKYGEWAEEHEPFEMNFGKR